MAPDGNNDFLLPTNLGPYLDLRDLILAPAGGTDTTKPQWRRAGSIFINGTDTGIKIVNGANLGTNLTRQSHNGVDFMQTPLRIAAGARVRVLQNT